MKINLSVILITLALLAISTTVFSSAVVSATPDSLYVKVRTTKLRAQPQQWAPAVADLRYGDSATPLGKSGAWHNVQFGSRSGYLHDSALTSRKVVLQASDSVAGSTDRDVVLAGKGFNSEVEKNYAAQNSSMNYSEVDKMERLTISDSEMTAFVRAGKLEGGN